MHTKSISEVFRACRAWRRRIQRHRHRPNYESANYEVEIDRRCHAWGRLVWMHASPAYQLLPW